MKDDASRPVRVCLTRCPLPPAETQVHSLPCRIHFDGLAAVKSLFLPQSSDDSSIGAHLRGPKAEEQDVHHPHKDGATRGNMLHAAFRGIQLQGEKLLLNPMGYTGLVMEDSGMRHPDDDGRLWEVQDHFDELVWWDVPNHTTSKTHQLPLVLQQWHDLASAIHGA